MKYTEIEGLDFDCENEFDVSWDDIGCPADVTGVCSYSDCSICPYGH